MHITHTVTVFDAADIHTEGQFWADLIGGSVEFDDDWAAVSDADGHYVLAAQLAPDHIRPQWPDGQPQQLHLDVFVGTPEEAVQANDEVTRLGATLLKPADDPDAESGFTVFADPAGHPFCICWG